MQSWLASLRSVPNLHFDVSPQRHGSNARSEQLDIRTMIIGEPRLSAPPTHVFDLLPTRQCWLSFDIETHDFAPNTGGSVPWVEGQYGHPCRFITPSLGDLRMVQLGWCIRKSPASTIVEKNRLISPSDFTVTKRAELKHGITTEQARRSGASLQVVLEEFLRDVTMVVGMGGAICAHQIEFDAGIIKNEMGRAGLDNKLAMWEEVASQGFCTMNHFVSSWSCSMYFDQVGCNSHEGRHAPVGLHDMVLALVPADYKLLLKHHDAGNDAKMALKIAFELQRRMAEFR